MEQNARSLEKASATEKNKIQRVKKLELTNRCKSSLMLRLLMVQMQY